MINILFSIVGLILCNATSVSIEFYLIQPLIRALSLVSDQDLDSGGASVGENIDPSQRMRFFGL